MDNAASVVVTKITAVIPLPADFAASLSTAELFTFYIPLMYVFVLPFLNTLLVILQECWKNAGKRRSRRMMKKMGNIGLVVSPQKKGYADLESGKKKAPAKGKQGLKA